MFDENTLNMLEQNYRARRPQVKGAQTTAPKKKKSFLMDQISTVGGIAGGIGGSFVAPLAGTAGGAALGSALGESLENVLMGESATKNVAKEAALGGVFGAGPLKLAKAGMALKGGATAGQAAKEGAEFSVRGAIGRKAEQMATHAATKQFGIQGQFINKFSRQFKEDPGKVLTRYGIASEDDVAKHITKQQQVFDDLVQSAGNIKKTTIQNKFGDLAKNLSKLGVPEDKLMGQQLMKETDDLLAQYGDNVPASVLNQVKARYDALARQTMGQDARLANLNKRVADGMREVIQDATGNKQLKQTGMELSKLRNLQDEIGKRAATVENRNASPLGLRNLLGAGIGGGVGFGAGGPVGGLVGAGAVAAVNSPTGRRLSAQGTQKLANNLVNSGGKAANSQLSNAARIGVPLGLTNMGDSGEPQPQSLEDALMGLQQQNVLGDQTTENQTPWLENGTSGPLDPETKQPVSPYSREALMYDMQRDPQNADKYMDYYKMIQEIYAPADGATDMSQSTRNSLASSDNALNTLNQLEGLYGDAGGGSGRVGGAVKGLVAKTGFDTGAKVYNDASNASVTQFAKALAGAGAGTVSDMDAKVILSFIPKITDTPAEARAKFAALRQRLDEAKNNSMLYGSGGGSLEDALMQQQGAY